MVRYSPALLVAILACWVLLGLLTIALVACSGGEGGNAERPAPSAAGGHLEPQAESHTSSTVTFGSATFVQLHSMDQLLKSYPTVVVATVDGVLLPFDPRPGFLGASAEELESLRSGPKGGPIPQDMLDRPAGSLQAVYSARVQKSITGGAPAEGSQIAITQAGGVFQGTEYEISGDPVIKPGSTYLFFLHTFDWQGNEFQLPADWPSSYQTIYRGTPFGRFVADGGVLSSVGGEVDCERCQVSALLGGQSVEYAQTIVNDAIAGRPLPSVGPRPTPTPESVAEVPLVAVSAGDPLPVSGGIAGKVSQCGTTDGAPVASGTASGAGGQTTLVDATLKKTAAWADFAVRIDLGAAAGQIRRVVSVQDGQIVVDPGWDVPPAEGSAYSIVPTRTIDVTVESVPTYDASVHKGGLAASGFTVDFDPAVIQILAVNPRGDADSLLAAGGNRVAFDIIDADGTLGAPFTPLPATGGHLRVDMADISQNFESGSGVLARLLIVPIGGGESALAIRDVEIVDASSTAYAVAKTQGATIAVAGSC